MAAWKEFTSAAMIEAGLWRKDMHLPWRQVEERGRRSWIGLSLEASGER